MLPADDRKIVQSAQREFAVDVLWFEKAIIHERQQNAMCRRQSCEIQVMARETGGRTARVCGSQQASLWADMPVQVDSGKFTSFIKCQGMGIG